eukprot:914683-Amphidinium_carterae.2
MLLPGPAQERFLRPTEAEVTEPVTQPGLAQPCTLAWPSLPVLLVTRCRVGTRLLEEAEAEQDLPREERLIKEALNKSVFWDYFKPAVQSNTSPDQWWNVALDDSDQ